MELLHSGQGHRLFLSRCELTINVKNGKLKDVCIDLSNEDLVGLKNKILELEKTYSKEVICKKCNSKSMLSTPNVKSICLFCQKCSVVVEHKIIDVRARRGVQKCLSEM